MKADNFYVPLFWRNGQRHARLVFRAFIENNPNRNVFRHNN